MATAAAAAAAAVVVVVINSNENHDTMKIKDSLRSTHPWTPTQKLCNLPGLNLCSAGLSESLFARPSAPILRYLCNFAYSILLTIRVLVAGLQAFLGTIEHPFLSALGFRRCPSLGWAFKSSRFMQASLRRKKLFLPVTYRDQVSVLRRDWIDLLGVFFLPNQAEVRPNFELR